MNFDPGVSPQGDNALDSCEPCVTKLANDDAASGYTSLAIQAMGDWCVGIYTSRDN